MGARDRVIGHDAVATIRGTTVDAIGRATTANARALLRI
jgi:hypothetical protein